MYVGIILMIRSIPRPTCPVLGTCIPTCGRLKQSRPELLSVDTGAAPPFFFPANQDLGTWKGLLGSIPLWLHVGKEVRVGRTINVPAAPPSPTIVTRAVAAVKSTP